MCVCETRIIYQPYASSWWQRNVCSSSCETQDVATVLLKELRWFTDVAQLSILVHVMCAPNNSPINCRYIYKPYSVTLFSSDALCSTDFMLLHVHILKH